MADYDLLGSFASGGAAQLNADLISKLKNAEKESVLSQIDKDLEAITGLDAETGDELDKLGELDTLTAIKAYTMDLMDKASLFDLSSSKSNAFEQIVASTTGSSAVFDAVDVTGLEPGTTNIEVTQLAQKDVYQSISFNGAAKDAQMSALEPVPADPDDLAYIAAAGLNINVDGEDYFFSIVQNPSAGSVAELGAKTISELADEINENEKLIASIETVGTDEYRLVIKSAESGLDNAITITQTNFDIGFGETEQSSAKIDDTDALISGGQDAGDKITINGIDFSTEGKTYEDLVNDINNYDSVSGTILDVDADPSTYEGDTFSASIVNGQIVITADDGSDVTITETGVDMGFYDSTGQTQVAQNLQANVDGVDYDIASNTMTIQGNLTMTAVEIGKSTIDIQKDNTSILSSLESVIEGYNTLVDLVNDQVSDPESNISDSSALRNLLSSIKEKLFDSYGVDGDLNLFNYGLDIDLKGHLSIDGEKFADGLNDHYDDIKSLLLGNTTDEDIAQSDSTKSLGLGYMLKTYLDGLDSTDGMFTRYENSITERKDDLEQEREDAIEALDLKYNTLAQQFSAYAAIITQMESSFSGLKMMIDYETASK